MNWFNLADSFHLTVPRVCFDKSAPVFALAPQGQDWLTELFALQLATATAYDHGLLTNPSAEGGTGRGFYGGIRVPKKQQQIQDDSRKTSPNR